MILNWYKVVYSILPFYGYAHYTITSIQYISNNPYKTEHHWNIFNLKNNQLYLNKQ